MKVECRCELVWGNLVAHVNADVELVVKMYQSLKYR